MQPVAATAAARPTLPVLGQGTRHSESAPRAPAQLASTALSLLLCRSRARAGMAPACAAAVAHSSLNSARCRRAIEAQWCTSGLLLCRQSTSTGMPPHPTRHAAVSPLLASFAAQWLLLLALARCCCLATARGCGKHSRWRRRLQRALRCGTQGGPRHTPHAPARARARCCRSDVQVPLRRLRTRWPQRSPTPLRAGAVRKCGTLQGGAGAAHALHESRHCTGCQKGRGRAA